MLKAQNAILGALALTVAIAAPPVLAKGDVDGLEQAFDRVFSSGATRPPQPAVLLPRQNPTGINGFEARLAQLAGASQGRIGVAAVDLSSGRGVSVMGDQPFPLASTGKIAVVRTDSSPPPGSCQRELKSQPDSAAARRSRNTSAAGRAANAAVPMSSI